VFLVFYDLSKELFFVFLVTVTVGWKKFNQRDQHIDQRRECLKNDGTLVQNQIQHSDLEYLNIEKTI